MSIWNVTNYIYWNIASTVHPQLLCTSGLTHLIRSSDPTDTQLIFNPNNRVIASSQPTDRCSRCHCWFLTDLLLTDMLADQTGRRDARRRLTGLNLWPLCPSPADILLTCPEAAAEGKVTRLLKSRARPLGSRNVTRRFLSMTDLHFDLLSNKSLFVLHVRQI